MESQSSEGFKVRRETRCKNTDVVVQFEIKSAKTGTLLRFLAFPQLVGHHLSLRSLLYEDPEGFFVGKRNWNWSVDAGADAKDVACTSAMGCFFF